MATVAFNATLFNNNVGISGIAMRTNDRRVFFVDDATRCGGNSSMPMPATCVYTVGWTWPSARASSTGIWW